MSSEVYRKINELDLNKSNYLETILTGEHAGEKGLFVEEKLCWTDSKTDFFEQRELTGDEYEKNQIYVRDGQQIFREHLNCERKLVICGAGHVSIPIIKIGKMLGFHVTVLEDRPLFANHARSAGADIVICDNFESGLEQISGDKNTYYVLVTRGHRYDQECLRIICEKPYAYIGMIGSRKRVKTVIEQLEQEGTDPEVLKEVHSPIGLDIGAETPDEIGVAIIAEIIDVKNKQRKDSGFSKEIMNGLLMERPMERMLATIVSRKGSAPRDVGTKMLIAADGTTVGTIGGGCMEAAAVRRARQLMISGEKKYEIYNVDLTGADAEDDGMVCGGLETIFFETV